jgi:dTDP-4-dehydrorhamnose reductase
VWGGIECTVNRVGDNYFDQIARCGHVERIEDLDRFAELGIKAIRYPVLWERIAPDSLNDADWSWTDRALERLRELGIKPIVGLVHHGSGPAHTSLVDPAFAEELAAFAGRVARQFPWVDAYTPVNEPLTTARFSGLYGHWYPHGRDATTFLKCLLTECRATVLAMRAVRQVNPRARLIQTEDLGETHSSPRLQYQADFENERRWLSWDLLCGRVTSEHPLREYLRWEGIADAELDWFQDNPCPPDVLGLNYYVTSERYLDECTERYPPSQRGGNGRDSYVDVEAVRILEAGPTGVHPMLRQAWKRYRLPLAITEAHLGCTREEQLRWLRDVWEGACQARAEGIDVRAVTAWSAFGAFDWDSLVTRQTGSYEPGLFDVRGGRPRATALAHGVQQLAQRGKLTHPAANGRGWWQRSERLLFPGSAPSTHRLTTRRCLLVTGAGGRLGRAIGRICRVRGLRTVLLSRDKLDVADPNTVASALERFSPWAVVNAAGYVRLDEAEDEATACRRANADGPAILAGACAERNIRLLTFSSAHVFDGTAESAYREDDRPAPLSVYGSTKAAGEQEALAHYPETLVVRTSGLFGPWDSRNFVARTLRTLRGGGVLPAASDVTLTPSYAPDLVNAALDLLIDGEKGVWHLAHPEPVTWAELAEAVAHEAGLDHALVEARPADDLGWKARRPRFAPLTSHHGSLMPSLERAIRRCVEATESETAWS